MPISMLGFPGIVAVALLVFVALPVQAAIHTEKVEYRDGQVVLEGFLAYDDTIASPRPGILVVHEWWGLNDYVRRRAEQLAALGYVAFAADMYGQGKSTNEVAQAQKWSGELYGKPLIRTRAQLALDLLAKDKHVDPTRLAAIGYCFGGNVVTQLAYSGADLAGVVSFHGNPAPPAPEDAGRIKARILILQGAQDAFMPPAKIIELEDALTKAGADWELTLYSGAKHAFTNPDADKHGIANIAYNKAADERSWDRMKQFFDQVFASKGGH